jgi:hypothetical protein
MTDSIGLLKLPINRLHMELTNACNFSCEFCPDSKMKRTRGMMSIEMARSIIDDVKRIGVAKTILFHIMGEPTLHPKVAEIVRYASENGLDTCLTTNGSLLDRDLLNELLGSGLGEMIISLQTPDEKTFSLRGAEAIRFDDYAERVVSIARAFLSDKGRTKLSISFLSSPLRRLIIPIYPEVSIADTSADLKKSLYTWLDKICCGFPINGMRENVLKQIHKSGSFRENKIVITNKLSFTTRILGDWPVHFDGKNLNALFGYCPGLQENFGISWNGDYTFCCTDFDGKTSTDNYNVTPIQDYLKKEVVQAVVRGFRRFRVVHPHCRQCLGDRNILNSVVKQVGSIVYFKWIRRKH